MFFRVHDVRGFLLMAMFREPLYHPVEQGHRNKQKQKTGKNTRDTSMVMVLETSKKWIVLLLNNLVESVQVV